ncbi:hypothetical protein GCM10017752_67300 [Streptomyces roseoviridis]
MPGTVAASVLWPLRCLTPDPRRSQPQARPLRLGRAGTGSPTGPGPGNAAVHAVLADGHGRPPPHNDQLALEDQAVRQVGGSALEIRERLCGGPPGRDRTSGGERGSGAPPLGR